MTASEIWFLRAEAALRGWTDEDEEACYRNGVTTSFHQWGIYGVEDYLKSELTASGFIDTYDEENNIEARCKVTPKWNPQDDSQVLYDVHYRGWNKLKYKVHIWWRKVLDWALSHF